MKNVESIAIGGFDGMHIGHQHLFDELDDNGVIVVIETGYANLTPGQIRERYCDNRIVYYSLDDIRHLDGAQFVSMLTEKFVDLKKIIVGYDFHFGRDRKYSFEDLKELFNGEVVVIDEVKIHNDSVHSHKIRAKLQLGDIEGANQFLGHNYTISGSVIAGQGLGKKELVPTVNMETNGYLLPKEGVYATLARFDDEEHYHPAVSFVGHRISTDGSFAVETHILDKSIDCKKQIDVSFISFIRENRRFDTLKALKNAIADDISVAKNESGHLSL